MPAAGGPDSALPLEWRLGRRAVRGRLMGVDSIEAFLDQLQHGPVLRPGQLGRLSHEGPAAFADPRALAADLVERGWLTAYQARKLLAGKAGDLFVGPYVLHVKVGEGGMGRVYRAYHTHLKRFVALKVLRPQMLANPTAVGRFRREAAACAHVEHPNIVRVFDADQADGRLFLAMEFVEGATLEKLVESDGPMPWREACAAIRQAAIGLDHAHKQGLIHRDIKPSNLIREAGRRGKVKILDLGLARLRSDDADDAATALTHEGSVVGTPDYMAPEQGKSSAEVDHRADLYSLGCTFYFVLTGKSVYPNRTAVEKLVSHQLEDPPEVRDDRSDVPEAVARVLRRLLAKDPEARHASAGELARELKPLADGKLPPAPQTAPVPLAAKTFGDIVPARPKPRNRPRGRRKARVAWNAIAGVLIGLGLFALMLLAVYILYSNLKP